MSVSKVNQSTPKLAVTVPEAARASGFSENYVRLLISRRLLPHVRVGRAVRVLVIDLERFLHGHRQEATSVE
jgi:excisionase family DNA binding protein